MTWDYIIVGSGFGGSITACRLAEGNKRVLVLERGRRWKEDDDFPLTKSWIFDHKRPEKHNGWIDVRLFGRMNVIQGAGIGGGSLIYANVSVEARPDVFEQGWPQEITYEKLKPYYDKVAKFMNVQVVPANQVPERFRLMERAARETGYEDRFRPVHLAVEFDSNLDVTRVPDASDDELLAMSKAARTTNQHGVQIGTCVHCGNCDIGCKFHAKSTLEKNYIPVAERAGAEFRPLHVVRTIQPQNGGYNVHFDRITADGKLLAGVESARNVIVAAGSLGSTELLFRCRDEHKTLPNISAFLGRNWTSNGDFLTPALYKDPPYPHRGPTITSVIDFGDGAFKKQKFWIQDGGYPNILLNYLDSFDKKSARAIARVFENIFDDNVMPWFAQGVDAGDGRLHLGRSWLTPWRKELKLDWDLKTNEPLFDAIFEMHHVLSKATGGEPLDSPVWTLLRSAITPHPLGGCNMGTSAANGVVNHKGEVFGYNGLYVADGSIIPRPIGRNPTRTIAALSERIADHMLEAKGATTPA
jgi:cholesterol oxidase